MKSQKRIVKKNALTTAKKRPANKQQTKKKRTARSKKSLIAAKKRRKKRQLKLFVLELSGAILITGSLVFLLSLFLFSLPKVEGYSMVPTLRVGDRVYVNKLGVLKTFKLVYIKIPGKKEKQIRRIIGVPGDKIVYKDDQLQINGVNKDEKFIFDEKQVSQENGRFYTEDLSLSSLLGEEVIPENKYLLLGDNRPYSFDSRQYGLVDEKDIIGVVEMRILPLHLWKNF